ncbi:CAAX protease self-immunity [Longilinea arvoryzae]|uniref:CAAX protease self-immunity n=1 Tax=Longilinea arvoryzae TaxID=360412 RepID=A0A0S7BHQ1_9CHLR|nr:CPBP family intramembrane glutamic endopeptidase [Longilinea arvoryzae]GAP13387.1 CAAX protease self-immunity [Longilinea arvoryzae]
MSQVKSVIFKYPILASIVFLLASVFLTEINFQDFLAPYLDFQNASYLVGIIEQGTVSVLLVILIGRLGILKDAGFTGRINWRSLWVIWPIFVYCVLNGGTSPFDGTFSIDTSQPIRIVLYLLLYLSTGFFEEILFRGLILNLFLRKWGTTRGGTYLAVVVSSSIFGIAHLINLVMGRRTLLSTLPQIAYGTFFGIFFAACFLRNKSIWPVIFCHALFDMCGNFQDIAVGSLTFGKIEETSPEAALVTIAIMLPLMLYGFFLLRKSGPSDRGRAFSQAIV